jgi:hypothetical protein
MSHERSKVFADTYQRYLKEIREIDFLAKAEVLGVSREGESLLVPLYDVVHRVSADGIESTTGENLTPAVQVMICKYILITPHTLPQISDKLVTYREFKDAAPLVSHFTNNTNKTLESHFSNNLEGLKTRALTLGAKPLESPTYDVSFEFKAFPRIPVILNFNDQDDMFPAACSILYRSSAGLFLDMECLSMTGTLLSGKLLATN